MRARYQPVATRTQSSAQSSPRFAAGAPERAPPRRGAAPHTRPPTTAPSPSATGAGLLRPAARARGPRRGGHRRATPPCPGRPAGRVRPAARRRAAGSRSRSGRRRGVRRSARPAPPGPQPPGVLPRDRSAVDDELVLHDHPTREVAAQGGQHGTRAVVPLRCPIALEGQQRDVARPAAWAGPPPGRRRSSGSRLAASRPDRPSALNYVLMGKPGVKTVEQMKGGSVAISRFGSATDTIARFALRRVGFTPGKDVTIVQVGSGPERLSACSPAESPQR